MLAVEAELARYMLLLRVYLLSAFDNTDERDLSEVEDY